MNKKRILITGAGGASAISVWKSLMEEHELFLADVDSCAAGLYLVPATRRCLLPRGDHPAFVNAVLEICKKNKINIIIPTVDVELAPLAFAKQQFLDAGIVVPLCTPAVLQLCWDKYALLKYCENYIPVPNYELLNNNTVEYFKTFPLFAKPRKGSGATGTFILRHVKDLDNLPLDDSYLIQEFLPGEEYSVDVYISGEGQPIVAVPRLRMKIDSGIAVAARTVILPDLTALGIKVAKHVGIHFVANVQFKQAVDGTFKLLEINPRFPGTLPLTAAAGIDIPKLLIKEILGQPLPDKLLAYEELMVMRYWTEHFCAPTEWQRLEEAY